MSRWLLGLDEPDRDRRRSVVTLQRLLEPAVAAVDQRVDGRHPRGLAGGAQREPRQLRHRTRHMGPDGVPHRHGRGIGRRALAARRAGDGHGGGSDMKKPGGVAAPGVNRISAVNI